MQKGPCTPADCQTFASQPPARGRRSCRAAHRRDPCTSNTCSSSFFYLLRPQASVLQFSLKIASKSLMFCSCHRCPFVSESFIQTAKLCVHTQVLDAWTKYWTFLVSSQRQSTAHKVTDVFVLSQFTSMLSAKCRI